MASFVFRSWWSMCLMRLAHGYELGTASRFSLTSLSRKGLL